MAGNPDCEKTEHNMHICALKAEGFDKKNPEEFKQLTDLHPIVGPFFMRI